MTAMFVQQLEQCAQYSKKNFPVNPYEIGFSKKFLVDAGLRGSRTV